MTRESLGWSELIGMGASTAAAIAVGLGIGWGADKVFDTLPVFLFVGLVLGIAAAVAYLVVTFRTYLKQ